MERRTEIRFSQTSPNFSPILRRGDVLPQPRRESGEAVLAEVAAADGGGAVGAGDDESEDEDEEDEEFDDKGGAAMERREDLFQ